MTTVEKQYQFFNANIHERRAAAIICRMFPAVFFIANIVITIVGISGEDNRVLLWQCAILNTLGWLYITSSAILAIVASCKSWTKVTESIPPTDEEAAQGKGALMHAIVIANYKEDEEMLRETLDSLAEAQGSKEFCVVLAMEAREGENGSKKALRLRDQYSESFSEVLITCHPSTLQETHLDESSDPEVAGKASNVKYAVSCLCDHIAKDNASAIDDVMLTIMDADVLFHPNYFHEVSSEFALMKLEEGNQHMWTMWQAPQLPFRNWYRSPIPSRMWGYLSSTFEVGGVCGLNYGFGHMTFSAYSVPLRIPFESSLWDGDVVAEDHHAYIKATLYAAYCRALQASDDKCKDEPVPTVQVRSVMLPAKSTSVISDKGYWHSWAERWEQQKRHCQGVAELSYLMLGVWDFLCTTPFNAYSFGHICQMIAGAFRCFCMHLLPTSQFVALGCLTILWIADGMMLPECPQKILVLGGQDIILCGLAGAWVLMWPVVIPFVLIGLSNVLMIYAAFIRPASHSKSIWAKSSGDIDHCSCCKSKVATLLSLVTVDLVVFFGPIMGLYGICGFLVSYWSVLVRGNRIKYVTATKAANTYGATDTENSPHQSSRDENTPTGMTSSQEAKIVD